MKMAELDILKEALPYIQRFKGKIFVIKLSGAIVSEPDLLGSLAEEVALLHQVGFFPVVIHGGGKQLNEMASKLGVRQKIIDGRRVTDKNTLELAKMVFAGQINTDVTSALRSHGVKTIGLSGADGQLVVAKKRGVTKVIDSSNQTEMEVDYGFVGDVVQVDTRILKLVLDEGYLPVISSLGADTEGNVFNINADTIASEIAAGLNAEKLIMLTNVNGILKNMADPKSRYIHLDIKNLSQLIETRTISDGMIPKAHSIIEVINKGVTGVHIVGSKEKNPLLREVFTDEGTGTMVTKFKGQESEMRL